MWLGGFRGDEGVGNSGQRFLSSWKVEKRGQLDVVISRVLQAGRTIPYY